MRRVMAVGALGLLVLAPALWALQETPKADKPKTPKEQYQALERGHQAEMQKLGRTFRAAKTDEERGKIREQAGKLGETNAGRFLDLAQKNPKDAAAFDALLWILQNAGESPQTNKALDILKRDHIASDRLGDACQLVAQSESPAADSFLKAVMEKSPNRKVQGMACFSLAQRLKEQADDAENPNAKEQGEEAEKLFDRVVKEFADVRGDQGPLGDAAKTELFGLRNLAIGKVAPQIEGEDIDGKRLKLSDYRGKVVVLDFWASWCGPCRAMYPHERAMVKRLEGKPFALLGINIDETRDIIRKHMADEKNTWRYWYDGAQGPIAKAWNVRSIPAIYVLDTRGVIRYKGLRGEAMDKAVDALIKEMESGKRKSG